MEHESATQETEHHMYNCGNCMRVIYSMETGQGGCDGPRTAILP